MTERGAGQQSQLIIWAAAEAHRLRRQATTMEDERPGRATAPEGWGSADGRGLVVDWQLSQLPREGDETGR
jgi:hypothetical protein